MPKWYNLFHIVWFNEHTCSCTTCVFKSRPICKTNNLIIQDNIPVWSIGLPHGFYQKTYWAIILSLLEQVSGAISSSSLLILACPQGTCFHCLSTPRRKHAVSHYIVWLFFMGILSTCHCTEIKWSEIWVVVTYPCTRASNTITVPHEMR